MDSTTVAMIEDEPSHEIYARIIGKDASKIIVSKQTTGRNGTSSSLDSATATATAAAAAAAVYSDSSDSRKSAIIPLDNSIPEPLRTSASASASASASCVTQSHIESKGIHSFASVYQRAMTSNPDNDSNNSHNNQNNRSKHHHHQQQQQTTVARKTTLTLDKNNKGFQLLTKMGFCEEQGGLGKARQGTLTPIHPKYNVGGKGLGLLVRLPIPIPRSTKDNNNYDMLVKKETKGQRRKRMQEAAKKDQMRNKRARMLINSDLPDEYTAFL